MAESKLLPPWCGVIGQPITHSLSPLLFSKLAARLHTPLVYRPIEVGPDALKPFLLGLRAVPLLVGLNVTLPHKRAVLGFADWVSVEAQAVGAANVLAFANGNMTAHNTDVMGVHATLVSNRVKVAARTAVVFGAGGAARAVVYALGQLKAAQVVVVNRTLSKARCLVRELQPHFPATALVARRDAQVDGAVGLVVNATSLGMQGQAPSNMVLPPWALPDAVAFDVVYRPAVTPFLRQARRAGYRPLGGLQMLVEQALAAYEIWFGALPPSQKLTRALMAALQREVRG